MIKNIFEISILKTIIFNIKYFGIKNGLKLPVLISRNFEIKKLKGSVKIEKIKFGIVKLGFGNISIFSNNQKGIWDNEGIISFKGKANIGKGVKISNHSILNFGNDINITATTQIICYKNITFGDNCLVSWDCIILDTDFHKIYDMSNQITNLDNDIVIENNVWIGCRSVILKGTYIPNNSIVASNSTVSKNFADNDKILIGSVNKILKENVTWKM